MLWRHLSDWMRQPVVKNANQMRCAVHITFADLISILWLKKSSLPEAVSTNRNRHSTDTSSPRDASKPRSYIQTSKQKITNTSLPSWAYFFPKLTRDPWHRDQSFAGPDPEAAFGYGNLKKFSKSNEVGCLKDCSWKALCSFEFVNVIIEIHWTDNVLKLGAPILLSINQCNALFIAHQLIWYAGL